MHAGPDYLPEEALVWAGEHCELLELIAGELVREGEWPSASPLTRRLAREGQAIPLATLLSGMPKSLGFVDNQPDRIVLLLFGLPRGVYIGVRSGSPGVRID